jgi:hypothetical protein
LQYKVEGLQGNSSDGLAIARWWVAAPRFYRCHRCFVETLVAATIHDLSYVNLTALIQFYP